MQRLRLIPLLFLFLALSTLPTLSAAQDDITTQNAASAYRGAMLTGPASNPLSFINGIGLAALETKDTRVPTDASGQIRLHYAADVSQRILSLDALPTEPLKDAIVLVGMQGQVVKTPLGPASIANVMAEGVEDLLSGQVLTRPDRKSVV